MLYMSIAHSFVLLSFESSIENLENFFVLFPLAENLGL